MTNGGGTAGELVRGLADRAGLDDLKQALDLVEQASRASGRVDAEVWSAVDLTGDERSALEARLRQRHGADLPVTYHVDPALIGGLVVRVGDRYLDGSLATRLGRLRQELLTGRA